MKPKQQITPKKCKHEWKLSRREYIKGKLVDTYICSKCKAKEEH